jgi:hypothetical protein
MNTLNSKEKIINHLQKAKDEAQNILDEITLSDSSIDNIDLLGIMDSIDDIIEELEAIDDFDIKVDFEDEDYLDLEDDEDE